MPVYIFRCLVCDKVVEKFLSITKKVKDRKCECGGRAVHDWVAENKGGIVDSQMTQYPFDGSNGTRLYPCAVLNEKDLAEARKKNPTTEYRQFNGCFIPVIKNRTEKLAFLKRNNFIELD